MKKSPIPTLLVVDPISDLRAMDFLHQVSQRDRGSYKILYASRTKAAREAWGTPGPSYLVIAHMGDVKHEDALFPFIRWMVDRYKEDPEAHPLPKTVVNYSYEGHAKIEIEHKMIMRMLGNADPRVVVLRMPFGPTLWHELNAEVVEDVEEPEVRPTT